jgi:hypothetical protein
VKIFDPTGTRTPAPLVVQPVAIPTELSRLIISVYSVNTFCRQNAELSSVKTGGIFGKKGGGRQIRHPFLTDMWKIKPKFIYQILVRKYISGVISVSILRPTDLGRSV